MTVTLELTKEQERLVIASVGRQDKGAVREVLTLALNAAVERLLHQTPAPAGQEDFDSLANQLGVSFTSASTHRSLNEEALTREGIYGDHP